MTAPLLSAHGVCRRIGAHDLLQHASLHIAGGELVGLIGPNGAGKSTLLSLLAGLDAPDDGEVHWRDAPLHALSDRERARHIGWLEQLGAVHWPISVERLVALGRLPHASALQRLSTDDRRAIDEALVASDCAALRHRSVTQLSGGERTRALLARVLAGEPQLILADEPVATLDPAHQLRSMELLREFARDERAAIVVLHELSHAVRWCDRLYVMHEGRIVAEGAPTEVLTAERLAEVYGIEALSGQDPVPWLVPIGRLRDPS